METLFILSMVIICLVVIGFITCKILFFVADYQEYKAFYNKAHKINELK